MAAAAPLRTASQSAPTLFPRLSRARLCAWRVPREINKPTDRRERDRERERERDRERESGSNRVTLRINLPPPEFLDKILVTVGGESVGDASPSTVRVERRGLGQRRQVVLRSGLDAQATRTGRASDADRTRSDAEGVAVRRATRVRIVRISEQVNPEDRSKGNLGVHETLLRFTCWVRNTGKRFT